MSNTYNTTLKAEGPEELVSGFYGCFPTMHTTLLANEGGIIVHSRKFRHDLDELYAALEKFPSLPLKVHVMHDDLTDWPLVEFCCYDLLDPGYYRGGSYLQEEQFRKGTTVDLTGAKTLDQHFCPVCRKLAEDYQSHYKEFKVEAPL